MGPQPVAVSKRFWSPEGERSVDELLRPGSDPKMDLGLALLGLHRAGAEACELVAKTALADERILLAALAETRAVLAEPAISAVSKSVGGPVYAGLMLRDLLDDAESAALSLYRSCLAKNVAPPIAAQRVGAVYGVPARDLGRYGTLATDPKASPAVLADLADRALFDHVSKVVTDELTDPTPVKETFSKAPTSDFTPDDPATPYYDGRSHGRFARTKESPAEVLPGVTLNDLLNPKPTSVGPAEVGEKQAAPSLKGTRDARQARLARRDRKARKAKLTGHPLPGQSLQRQSIGGQSIGAQRLGKQKLDRQAVRMQQLASEVLPDLEPPKPGLQQVPDFLKRREDLFAGEWKPLDNVAFVMSGTQFTTLRRQAGRGEKRLGAGQGAVTLLGPLRDFLKRGPNRYGDTENPDAVSEEHEEAVDEVLNEHYGKRTLLHERLGARDQTDLDNANDVPELFETRMKQVKTDFLRRQFDEHPELGDMARTSLATELSHVKHLPASDDPHQWVLVWQPPTAPTREIPTVVELIADGLQGIDEGEGAHYSDIQLDPNLAIQFFAAQRQGEDWDGRTVGATTFDTHHEAIRIWMRAEPINEDDVGKASDYLEAHDVTQAKDGRFVRLRSEVLPGVSLQDILNSKPAEPAQEAAVPTRSARQARQKRQARSQRRAVAPAALQQSVGRQSLASQDLFRQSTARQELSRADIARQQTRPPRGRGDEADLVYLESGQDYAVITPQAMDAMMALDHQTGFVEDLDTDWVLTPKTRKLLASSRVLDGDVAERRLQQDTFDRQNNSRTKEAPDGERFLGKQRIASSEDFEEIAPYLMAYDFVRVRFETDKQGQVHVSLWGNAEVMPLQNVVHFAGEPDVERVHTLIPGNVKRMQNVNTMANWLTQLYEERDAFQTGDPEDTLANPYVKTWVAVTR